MNVFFKSFLILKLILVFSVPLHAAGNGISINITNLNDGAYRLQAEFLTLAAPHTVWQVLTDYNNLPRFVSTMKESQVKKRRGQFVVVEQSAGIPLFLWVNANRKVVLNIQEFPEQQIKFVDTFHDQIEQYDGFWKIIPQGSGTRVVYQINVKIPYIPFDFFSEKSLSEFSQNNLEELMREMNARSEKK
jgi:ribosome-associated toxin RatA of RatAB toxin-antitoxin module